MEIYRYIPYKFPINVLLKWVIVVISPAEIHGVVIPSNMVTWTPQVSTHDGRRPLWQDWDGSECHHVAPQALPKAGSKSQG